MRFNPERAAIRFGCGLSPKYSNPTSVDDMLSRLQGPDFAAEKFPIPGFDEALAKLREAARLRRAYKKAEAGEAQETAKEVLRLARRNQWREKLRLISLSITRRAITEDGFRERLVAFWADHFTAIPKSSDWNSSIAHYIEESIRPNVALPFNVMLRAVATSPLMLHYLDQNRSVGPNSRAAKRSNGRRGLNENLARELMELHTLGVDGPYTQTDVRELARLIAGLGFEADTGFVFHDNYSDPGTKDVLGVRYGDKRKLEEIFRALDNLATHPATARHLSRKLAVHFVGDNPDPDLVSAMERRYIETKGELTQVYEVMLSHPSSWGGEPANVKQPMDFIGSSLRALDIRASHMPGDNPGKMRELFLAPLILMGQGWGRPTGPDGWPEEDHEWITPQRFAARLQWAMIAPFRLRRVLPDPRDFVDAALGSFAPEEVRFAAKAAESRSEGIGVVLASPAFQRM
jgi:uncharacterized protein (DUF1800 family)